MVTEVKFKKSFVCCHINVDVILHAQSRDQLESQKYQVFS